MLLEGKKGLVLNVTNKHSIGWAIARVAHEQGATLAVGAQDSRLQDRVQDLTKDYDRMSTLVVDFSVESELEALVETVKERFGTIDFLVHSAAYAKKEDLQGRFIETSRDGFSLALDISAYSLIRICKYLEPVLADDASVMAMSFLGATRAATNYNIMGVAKAALESSVRYLAVDLGQRGIRVNTVSPGPVNTVAARGVKDLLSMIQHVHDRAPLKRGYGQDEVAGTCAYLMSDLSKGVTGQIIFVDSGYNIASV